jgi:hypothetical protein
MNDSQFALNPIVTLNHAYSLPPVGRSLWRKRVKDGERAGIKAKTIYPAKPEKDWPNGKDWPPDVAFALVQNGLMNAKSIGLLPVKAHAPKEHERQENSALAKVDLILDEWILLEYSCCYLGVQQNATVEAVSKSLSPEFAKALGIEAPPALPTAPFITLDEYQRAIEQRVAVINWDALANEAVQSATQRQLGRV